MHQEDHMPAHLDGFQLYRGGLDVLRLRRVDSSGRPAEGGRTGKYLLASAGFLAVDFLLTYICCRFS